MSEVDRDTVMTMELTAPLEVIATIPALLETLFEDEGYLDKENRRTVQAAFHAYLTGMRGTIRIAE